jgi:histidyl-tRNA synthetase
MFKRVSGTKDILPDELGIWQRLEEISRNIFSLYNFKEIRPPLIEDAALFNRSLGESTEIIQKQMFLIKNKEETYALRPEGTASIVRTYIENDMDKTCGFTKLYYIGPMFRLERPQKGRLRQFHHIGCEAIGSTDPGLDVEIISLADTLLRNFCVEDYVIRINTLGCSNDKKKLIDLLRENLKNKLTSLCDDCQSRFEKNPLRIMDCKNESCKEIVNKLSIGDAHLCTECKDHYASVRSGLDMLKINYLVCDHLVRGLDYYTGTVFEITHKDLGSQDAIGAGGRYNNLVKELGGPQLGAIGFAFGVERILLLTKLTSSNSKNNLSFIITLGDEAKDRGLKLLDELRKNMLAADADFEGKSIKGAMRRANDLGARFVLIIGENEIKNSSVTLKDMSTGEQKELKACDIIKEIKC